MSNLTANLSGRMLKPSVEKPWLKYFPEESLAAKMPRETIYQYIKKIFEKDPKGKALHYYGTSWNHSQLLEKIERAADAFTALGIKAGDIVTFLSVTTPETIYMMYGLNKIGAISNLVDPRMDTSRITDAIVDVKSKVLITIDLAWPKVAAIRDKLELDDIIVISPNDSLPAVAKVARKITSKGPKIPYGDHVINTSSLMSKAKKAKAKEVGYDEGSIALITYTGGTTGTPKGVLITNDGLNVEAESFRLSGVDVKPGERFLDIMPIFAAYGVGCGIHMPLALSMENVIIPKFTPDELGALIKKYKPGHMMGVPSFYERIMHSKEMWDFDLSFFKTTGCGGDTMNDGLGKRFNDFLREHGAPYEISQGYGMSELSGAATCCFSGITRLGSSGIPLLGVTVSIFHPETGEEMDYGQEGEICITGPTMMRGYYNNPEETDMIMRRHFDGTVWVHSGDIGYMDKDGFVYIKGRVKQIIIRFDGHKVFPVSIEKIVGKHKAVATCAVVGIPDPDHAQGQQPLVVAELKKTISEADKENVRKEILDMCFAECEERGRPIDVTFIDDLPHTGMGKNDYRKLTDMYKNFAPRR
ncbi:MAG: acyl--CoA ligase [Clostridia bacterium]|nr:acyl--CoA ligase [Clostridia bacterium]